MPMRRAALSRKLFVTTSNPADGYLAQAVWVSSGGTTVGFDIRFNRDYTWAWGAAPGKFDIETVNLHEVQIFIRDGQQRVIEDR